MDRRSLLAIAAVKSVAVIVVKLKAMFVMVIEQVTLSRLKQETSCQVRVWNYFRGYGGCAGIAHAYEVEVACWLTGS